MKVTIVAFDESLFLQLLLNGRRKSAKADYEREAAFWQACVRADEAGVRLALAAGRHDVAQQLQHQVDEAKANAEHYTQLASAILIEEPGAGEHTDNLPYNGY